MTFACACWVCARNEMIFLELGEDARPTGVPWTFECLRVGVVACCACMGRRRKRHLVRDKGHDRNETLDLAAVEVLLTSNRPLRHGRARSHLGQGCPGPCNTIKMCVGEAHGENGRKGSGFFPIEMRQRKWSEG